MTNPDNVGGLPAFVPEPKTFQGDELHRRFVAGWNGCRAKLIDNLELCRAAPAGGDPTCPECKAPGLLFECVACSHSNYPQDSAPAGSGEVDAMAERVARVARHMAGSIRVGSSQISDHEVATLNEAAALLRKLQQGADYEPAFWNVRKDGKHLILFPLNGAVTITTYLEMVAGAHPGAAIDAETLYRAASPGKEAFNG